MLRKNFTDSSHSVREQLILEHSSAKQELVQAETELLKPSLPEVTAAEEGLHCSRAGAPTPAFHCSSVASPMAWAVALPGTERAQAGPGAASAANPRLLLSRPRKAGLSKGGCVRSEPELGRTTSRSGRAHLLTLSCPTRRRKRNNPAPQPDEAEAMWKCTSARWCHPQAPPHSPSAPPRNPSAPPHSPTDDPALWLLPTSCFGGPPSLYLRSVLRLWMVSAQVTIISFHLDCRLKGPRRMKSDNACKSCLLEAQCLIGRRS